MGTEVRLSDLGFQSGFYNIKNRVRNDKEALEIAKKNMELFRKAFKENPEPLRVVDNHYLDKVMKRTMEEPNFVIMSLAGWKMVHSAYPDLKLDYRMLIPVESREEYKTFFENEEILKDYHIHILLEKGNTIASKRFSKEEIIKEAKEKTGLDVIVREFRFYPDQHFYLVETEEISRKLDNKITKINWHV